MYLNNCERCQALKMPSVNAAHRSMVLWTNLGGHSPMQWFHHQKPVYNKAKISCKKYQNSGDHLKAKGIYVTSGNRGIGIS